MATRRRRTSAAIQAVSSGKTAAGSGPYTSPDSLSKDAASSSVRGLHLLFAVGITVFSLVFFVFFLGFPWLGYYIYTNFPIQWFVISVVVACGTYIAYVVHLLSTDHQSRFWEAFANSSLMHSVVAYFQMDLVIDGQPEAFDPSRRRIYGYHPHGIFGTPCIALLTPWAGWKRMLPGVPYPRFAIASVLYLVPVVREFFLYLGGCTVSRGTLSRILDAGEDVMVTVGGSQEVLLAQRNSSEDVLYLKRRKGFVRLALTKGADLVPVYALGHTDTYNQVTLFRRYQQWFVHKFKAVVPLFYGRCLTPIPFPANVTVLVGAPIHVERNASPSADDIDKLHAEYVKALTSLFEKHKVAAGYGHKSLVIT